MFEVDLRYERFVKVWRIDTEQVKATAAVIRRGDRYSAAFHYRTSQGNSCLWRWPGSGGSLSERELVQSILSIERSFQSAPTAYERIDFPHDSTRAEQMVLLMDHGLLHLVAQTDQPLELLESETP